MRSIIIPLLLASLIAAGVCGQDVGGPFPIDLHRVRALLAQAEALSAADDGALWGVKLYGPTIFVDPVTRAAAANAPDKKGHLRKHDETLYIGRLPADVPVGNTTMPWAGRHWTMLLWPLPGDDIYCGALLMHESFHRVQASLKLPLAMPDNHHLDTPEGRLWMRLEWRALAEALEEVEPLTCDALTDALVFRAYRRSLFKTAAKEERELENNEGLAEYTGLRLCGADDETKRRRAIDNLGMYDGAGPLVRSFAYASGPAYGLLLDQASPGWQKRYSENDDYGTLLARAIEFRLPKGDKLEEEAKERAGLFDFELLLAEEAEREGRRRERVGEYRERFVDGPVLTIEMNGEFRYSFSPYNVQALDGVGTLYGTMQLTGPFGTLDARKGALLIEDRKGKRRLRLPAPEDPRARPLEGDGWTMRLSEGWTLRRDRRKGDYIVAPARR